MYAFLFRLYGDEELVRERMCCAIALSLSLSFIHSLTHSQNIQITSLFGEGKHTHTRAHTNSLNMRIQNYHLNKKDKNGLLCFIRLGKQQKKRKKKKNIVQTGILLTQTNHHTSATLAVIHTHSQKYSLL